MCGGRVGIQGGKQGVHMGSWGSQIKPFGEWDISNLGGTLLTENVTKAFSLPRLSPQTEQPKKKKAKAKAGKAKEKGVTCQFGARKDLFNTFSSQCPCAPTNSRPCTKHILMLDLEPHHVLTITGLHKSDVYSLRPAG